MERAEKNTNESTKRLPAVVRQGFNMDDYTRRIYDSERAKPEIFLPGTTFLFDGIPPATGMIVKVKLICKEPTYRKKDKPYLCVMTGVVKTVLGSTRIQAIVRPSSTDCPTVLLGNWEATLVYDDDMQFPWILESLSATAEEPPPLPTPANQRLGLLRPSVDQSK